MCVASVWCICAVHRHWSWPRKDFRFPAVSLGWMSWCILGSCTVQNLNLWLPVVLVQVAMFWCNSTSTSSAVHGICTFWLERINILQCRWCSATIHTCITVHATLNTHHNHGRQLSTYPQHAQFSTLPIPVAPSVTTRLAPERNLTGLTDMQTVQEKNILKLHLYKPPKNCNEHYK